MRDWYDALQAREQRMVQLVALVVAIGLLYWAIWNPLSSSLDEARQGVVSAEQELKWMKEQAELALLRKSSGRAAASGSLSNTVNRSARALGVQIDRMQPQGEALQVWIDEIEWQQFISWLEVLYVDHGISAASVDLAKSKAEGHVKVRRLLLTRS